MSVGVEQDLRGAQPRADLDAALLHEPRQSVTEHPLDVEAEPVLQVDGSGRAVAAEGAGGEPAVTAFLEAQPEAFQPLHQAQRALAERPYDVLVAA